ncbi:MAG: hypothetical protein EXR93_03430 [Gemmatimonadetes bacterium]|nr:hypothetical protein [Gemmatimonadota bacterium]
MKVMHYSLAVAALASLLVSPAQAQRKPGEQGSRNVKILSHIPLGAGLRIADIEIEQELSRPYAYVTRRLNPAGFQIINLKDPAKAYVMYNWWIENPDLHQGAGGLGPTYVKTHGRYYYVSSFQFSQGGPDVDLGAIVFDVTGLPDTSKIKEVGRIREPGAPGGFHEIYGYKHSSGASLVFTTTQSPFMHIYDIDRFVAGDAKQGLVGRIENPTPPDAAPGTVFRGWHDAYVGYDPASHQDRFYGAGAGGYFVFDVTNVAEPRLLSSMSASGLNRGHTFTPDPTGRYAIAESEYQYAPLRVFDMKPRGDTLVKTGARVVGAYTADWKGLPHNTEVRWPYVFVSHYEDGLQVFNMMDPTNPYTVGFYDTYDGPTKVGACGDNVCNGAFGVDVRNADGLVVISDLTTGFWSFKMEGFDGWNGHQWGVPNISSAQDWDNGPDGAPKPQKVS